jgi:DNA-binding transcriptional regulator YhcF (GntR family)
VDFVLKRKGGVPLHDQLLAQLELRILTGVLAPGQRLPSVRALARRLGLHANTVSSAYRQLEAAGHVELRRGAGVYVRSGTPASLEDAHGLDELIRLALSAAFRKGHSGAEIRAAVERWLRAAPPERVVVVDPRRETLELVAHEIRTAIGVPAAGCTLEELEREPGLASGALLVALPYHAARVARAVPGTPVETIRVEASEEAEKAVLALPGGGTVVLVSSSPILRQIAQGRISGLRGDELLVEAKLVSRRAEWRRLLPAADLVLVDALAAGVVREARPRRLRELRLVGERDLARLRKALGRAESAA